MPMSYLIKKNNNTEKEFLDNGYVIQPVEDINNLNFITSYIANIASDYLHIKNKEPNLKFLNNIHKLISINEINKFRLYIYDKLNNHRDIQEIYYSLSKNLLNKIVGNELAIQKRINLSIQLPLDDSSLLPVHSDVWSGDSPFEVVIWLPLVDCYQSKSMFLLPPKFNKEAEKKLYKFKNSEEIYKFIKPNLKWININYGEIMVFSQNLMHGNTLNKEEETRWSLNCRYKSLFSPYSEKKMGDFFEPINILPATKLGMEYDLPKGF